MQYESQVRTKNTEMQTLNKSGLKDSIRVAYFDLGNIHCQYGFMGQALNMWEKAYETSSSEEDQKKMCFMIMRTAFSSGNQFYLNRYCEKARYHLNQNYPQQA